MEFLIGLLLGFVSGILFIAWLAYYMHEKK